MWRSKGEAFRPILGFLSPMVSKNILERLLWGEFKRLFLPENSEVWRLLRGLDNAKSGQRQL